MVSEAIAFACGALIFLTVIGLGLTDLLLPADGFQLLLAPAVGLAVLALGFQWLTFVVPPHVAAVVVFVVFGGLTAPVVWRRRTKLLARWQDLLGGGAVSLAFFGALIQIDLQQGFFTLAGFPSDNVFIYIQTAQYLVDHSMPLPHQVLSLVSPGSVILATGTEFPNSVGTIDAVARALLASNQLLYWVIGMGFQQESLALPVFIGGLGSAALAVRTESVRAGALTGVLGASLIGVYLPIAVLLLVCATGCAGVFLVADRKISWKGLLRPAVGGVAVGAVAGLAALYVLLFGGGLALWLTLAPVRAPAGGISRFPPLPYLLGTLPFAHVWELLPQPYGTLERLALPGLVLASALLVLLLVVGYGRATIQQHASEAAILGAGFLFAGYEAAVARYPYGFVKAIGYIVPLTSAFIAFGGIGLDSLFRPPLRRLAQTAGVGALAIVIGASALASRDMVRLWLDNPSEPTFPRSYLQLSAIAREVPIGSSVLIDVAGADYATLVRVGAVAYFLPDRTVRVYVGDLRLGTFPDQDARPEPCLFDYVISSATSAVGFSLIYADPTASLNVYKHEGARC